MAEATLRRPVEVEPATASDTPAVKDLLVACRLPLAGVADAFRRGIVAREDGRLVGCAGIEAFDDIALLRSVAVAESSRGRGVGRTLVEAVEAAAVDAGVRELYLLTESAETWFSSLGYAPLPRSDVPPAIAASVEFVAACPVTAVAMRRTLAPGDRDA